MNRAPLAEPEATAGQSAPPPQPPPRKHRQKFGAYPEKLSDLVDKFPAHFKELPADPFSGKPFLYKRTDSGCIVWGVGEDRADDGGDQKKDIVFEVKTFRSDSLSP